MNNDEKATILIPWAMTLAEKKKQRFNMYVRSNACLQKSNDKSLKAEG
jgi:hypothetical protein